MSSILNRSTMSSSYLHLCNHNSNTCFAEMVLLEAKQRKFVQELLFCTRVKYHLNSTQFSCFLFLSLSLSYSLSLLLSLAILLCPLCSKPCQGSLFSWSPWCLSGCAGSSPTLFRGARCLLGLLGWLQWSQGSRLRGGAWASPNVIQAGPEYWCQEPEYRDRVILRNQERERGREAHLGSFTGSCQICWGDVPSIKFQIVGTDHWK